MALQNPFSFKKWIDENRHLLKPPVGNRQVYVGNDDFIVMVVGGPNKRKDYQLEGDIVLRVVDEGVIKDIPIKEGEIFLLPPKMPHSPQRPANTVGLVMELHRNHNENDGFLWFCENCHKKLYEEYLTLTDIVKQLPPIMNRFYESEHTECKHCGTKMTKP